MKTYFEWKEIDGRWNGYIHKTIKAYERDDNKNENKYADLLEKEIAEYGVTCDWPGLHPVFQIDGHDIYGVDNLVNELSKKF